MDLPPDDLLGEADNEPDDETDAATVNTAGSNKPAANPGGRPPDAIKAHFTAVGQKNPGTKRFDQQCNYCKTVLRQAQVQGMRNHIVSKCMSVPAAVRKGAAETVAAGGNAVASVKPTTKQAVEDMPSSNVQRHGLAAL